MVEKGRFNRLEIIHFRVDKAGYKTCTTCAETAVCTPNAIDPKRLCAKAGKLNQRLYILLATTLPQLFKTKSEFMLKNGLGI
jgi:hypothetical protein